MAVINQSWLYKNDSRKYPLVDKATGSTSGLVDASVSLPKDLGSGRVYVEGLVVSENVAIVSLALEGYTGPDGSAVIATATVEAPDAFRLYPLTGVAPGVRGYVIFGSACQAGRDAVSDTHTAADGALLESVLVRYVSSSETAFIVDGVRLLDRQRIQGIAGVVAEITQVYFQDTNETKPAMVLRLDRTKETMRAPVAPCDMPAEVAERTDLATSINGILPDPNGTIFLKFASAYDFQYVDGAIALDPVTGLPLYDLSRPLLQLVPGGTSDLVFKDNFDYRVLCTGKRSLTTIKRSAEPGNCVNCTDQVGNPGSGLDLADGLPISMVGSAIWQDNLVIYWAFNAQGTPVVGANPLDIVISQPPGTIEPLKVVGIVKVAGSPPKFPSDLIYGTLTPITPGTLGDPVYSVYKLNRPAVAGEQYTLRLPKSSVVRNQPPVFPVGYPTYHSAPKDDTCTRYARDPASAPSSEFA